MPDQRGHPDPKRGTAPASGHHATDRDAGDWGDASRRPPYVHSGPAYAALDLGTNNCRLLVARPSRRGFKVIDAFSRIIRLGEGVTATGRLSDAAMTRTLAALSVCANKMARHERLRARLVATEACRIASNGGDFLQQVKRDMGLDIEIITRAEEARLAVSSCASLIDDQSDLVLVFDIGGGSSELVWLDLARRHQRSSAGSSDRPARGLLDRVDAQACIIDWISLPVGVVTLAERFGGRFMGPHEFDEMVAHVTEMLAAFEARVGMRREIANRRAHLLGTSGTVTTIAGVHMGLPRYDRSRVDGAWMAAADVQSVTRRLVDADHDARIAEPCIGRERADLVLAGCAILEAMLRQWPCERLRVADRGLREGILATLMAEDAEQRRAHRQR